MPDRGSRTVVGGSVAALVAADTLAARGCEVHVVLPEKGVGGGFLPLRRAGRRLELGVRLLELGYEDDTTPPSLDTYVPGFGGHRPFTPLVRDYVAGLVGERLVEVARPRMVLDGRDHDDVFLTVDLTTLPDALGPARTVAVATEAARAARRFGDAGVLPHLNGDALAQASVANHGRTLHETLIEPVADKFLARGSERTLAAWRRKVWMPLFWPRTVAEACAGRLSFRPARRFETVGDDGPGAVVEALLARLRARPGITVTVAGPLRSARTTDDVTELHVEGLGVLRTTRPVLGAAPRELFAAIGHPYAPERARSVLAWLEVPREAPIAVTHVVDAANPVARVSDSGPGAGRAGCATRVLCVELRHDVAEGEIERAALAGVVAAGIVPAAADATTVLTAAAETFDAPTAATRDAHAAALADLDAAGLDAIVVGGATAPGADSFNEQVVAGLAAAEALA